MTTPHDPLRDRLHGIADTVAPVDLYESALRRSRSIARQRAAAGAALVTLGLLGGGLWQLHPFGDAGPPVAAASSTARLVRPPSTLSPAAGARSITDIPGTLFYRQDDAPARLLRLRPGSAPTQVLADQPGALAVSPDGRTAAYVSEAGDVMLVNLADSKARQRFRGAVTDGYEPAWSPDGSRLMIARQHGNRAQPGTLDVATGAFAPLTGDLAAGRHFQWSGDGSSLVYGIAPCRLAVGAASGGGNRTVPVVGDPDTGANPTGMAACIPISVDVSGTRVAVTVQGQDAGLDKVPQPADAVVDVATGEVISLPVPGTIKAVLFHPDGDLLVRSSTGGRTLLTVFSPGGVKLVEAVEPAALAGLSLLSYTR